MGPDKRPARGDLLPSNRLPAASIWLKLDPKTWCRDHRRPLASTLFGYVQLLRLLNASFMFFFQIGSSTVENVPLLSSASPLPTFPSIPITSGYPNLAQVCNPSLARAAGPDPLSCLDWELFSATPQVSTARSNQEREVRCAPAKDAQLTTGLVVHRSSLFSKYYHSLWVASVLRLRAGVGGVCVHPSRL